MESNVPGSIDAICTKFRNEWSKSKRTRIAELLNQVEPVNQPQLMAELIRVELDLRMSVGESPNAKDYSELGAEAIRVARQHLEQPKSIDAEMDDESTVYHSIHDQANEDRTRGWDGLTKEDDAIFGDAGESGDSLEPGDSERDSISIGRYKLVRRIGIGGMGAVWLAEQQHPVKRNVALKVIRSDVDTKSAIARFEAERQAIAMMDHQNIAKILDAGTTESGNPYFVMELVDGLPFNEYCDKHSLGIRERLKLMVPICRAVQHAHQKAIIHRDLKHSNVLVAEYEGEPVPKVIDFGLAKALDQRYSLTETTMFTEVGNVVGTLQYMSPEQADTENLDVDTRSDIYSLGVMIYKLLVGATPLECVSQDKISLFEALRFIREHDSFRPSSFAGLGNRELKVLCERRQVQPEKLKQILEGDLDWIVMKALEKDRHDRYQTANALSMEIERYLRDERVLARPPSAMYTLKKFVKRNRGLVVSVLGISCLLIAGIFATSAATWWAVKERDRANRKAAMLKLESQNARDAEKEARESESARSIELLAMRLNSAWSDWQLGDAESAWGKLNQISPSQNGWESRYLRSEFGSDEQPLYGHAGKVITIDVSADGRYVASGATDDSVKIWDAHTKELLYTRMLEDEPLCVRFSPDSKRIACADRSNRISFWQVESGQPHAELGPYPTDIKCIAFLPDGERILAGAAERDSYREGSRRVFGDDGAPSIRLVSIGDGEVLQELLGHTGDIESIDVSQDGRTIVSGSSDTSIRVWRDTEEQFESFRILNDHVRGVTCVSISPNDRQIVSSGEDLTVRLWDLETGQVSHSLVGHTDAVRSARFSDDGGRIVSASEDRTVRVWSLTGEQLLSCQGHFGGLFDARFSVSGDELLSASADKTVRVWNAWGNPSTIVVRPHTDEIWAADFSMDGRTIACASEDGTVSILDSMTGEQIHAPLGHEAAVLSVAFSPDAQFLATGGADNQLSIWNATDFTLIKTIDAHQNFIWDVSFSNDGRFLATASADLTAKIWDTRDWSLVKELTGHRGELGSARFSRNGKYLVTSSDDETVRLWDTESFEMVHCFEGHQHAVWRAIFSPNDALIYSTGYNGELITWDVASRKLLSRVAAHTNQIAGVASTLDGERIVTASDDETIKVWDSVSGIELFVLRDKGDTPITHVSFSEDGKRLVSGNGGGYVTIRAISDKLADTKPFLPMQANAITVAGLRVITSRSLSEEELERELQRAEKCCSYYPSYRTYANLGIAQFRLGQFTRAIESLEEADRLEPIQYGEPDELPYIEGYLAMALFRTNELERAELMRAEFEAKWKGYWEADERITSLAQEIEQVFAK